MFRRIAHSIRMNILVGLFLAIPLVATFLIIRFLFTLITNYLVAEQLLQGSFAVLYRLIALVGALISLYFIGLFTRNIIGKTLYKFGDNVLTRIPIINSIYISIRQISESLVSSRNALFKQVVAVQYPRKGIYAIAFLTASLPDDFLSVGEKSSNKEEFVNLFIPTSPNPTSGFLLMFPRSEVVPLNLSVAQAMKMIISGGTVLPGSKGRQIPTLLDHLEELFKHDTLSSKQEKTGKFEAR